ncbi:MAG: glycosyltransferase family 39 protein [Candidatus Shapirobacteria bacterium]|nr:glycosyltransferase family 39 protein [Candidatus Shapirobacteria bacterium]
MKNIKKSNKKIWLMWGLVGLMAIIFRFSNYENRWVINQDQARDAVIGLYGLRNGQWPEIGSPSSAGPFNFGPWYHWLIMIFEKILPFASGPWVAFTVLSVISVFLFAMIGKKYYGKLGIIIFGLMAAMAVGQAENGPDMLNTVIVGFFSTIALWAIMKLLETEKLKWAVLVGAGVGWAINSHFQAWGLMSLPLAIFLVNKFSFWKKIKWLAAMGLGWLITFIPLLRFDIYHNGVWIKSVIEYYTVGVKKFYVPVRWLTEIRDFWPQLFGSVTVGINWFGYIWLILGLIVLGVIIKKRNKIKKFWWILALSLVIQIGLMRMYRGVRSKEYLIAFHGYIILFCSWIVAEWFKLNKYLGIIILSTVLILAGINNWKIIYEHQSQAKTILEIKEELDKNNKGPMVIEHFKESDMASMPLFYLYYRENKIDNNGTKISVCDGNKYQCPGGETIIRNNYRIYINKNFEWYELTPENIYGRLMVNYGK